MIITLFTHLIFFFFVIPFIIAPPILRYNPCFVVGTPTLCAIFVFRPLIPTARFNENGNPLIFKTQYHNFYIEQIPAIIKAVPIIKRIISIIRPKQPNIASNPAADQKQNPTITKMIPNSTSKIIQQATRTIIRSNSLIIYLGI